MYGANVLSQKKKTKKKKVKGEDDVEVEGNRTCHIVSTFCFAAILVAVILLWQIYHVTRESSEIVSVSELGIMEADEELKEAFENPNDFVTDQIIDKDSKAVLQRYMSLYMHAHHPVMPDEVVFFLASAPMDPYISRALGIMQTWGRHFPHIYFVMGTDTNSKDMLAKHTKIREEMPAAERTSYPQFILLERCSSNGHSSNDTSCKCNASLRLLLEEPRFQDVYKDAKWIVFGDDDIYVRAGAFLMSLSYMSPNVPRAMGMGVGTDMCQFAKHPTTVEDAELYKVPAPAGMGVISRAAFEVTKDAILADAIIRQAHEFGLLHDMAWGSVLWAHGIPYSYGPGGRNFVPTPFKFADAVAYHPIRDYQTELPHGSCKNIPGGCSDFHQVETFFAAPRGEGSPSDHASALQPEDHWVHGRTLPNVEAAFLPHEHLKDVELPDTKPYPPYKERSHLVDSYRAMMSARQWERRIPNLAHNPPKESTYQYTTHCKRTNCLSPDWKWELILVSDCNSHVNQTAVPPARNAARMYN